ncbi:MAG: hypothetical protein PHI24_14485 [Desulfitobacteriaceae bacterium]|nr:hypothetical protein [Desulfitobacteriaceae bacterium]
MGKDTAMDRITQPLDKQGSYIVDLTQVSPDPGGCTGEAINRLGRFEDFYEHLLESQREIPKELQKLRNEGKEKTVTYKELMVKKLNTNHILTLLKRYGL